MHKQTSCALCTPSRPLSLKVRTRLFQSRNAGFKSRRGHYGQVSLAAKTADCIQTNISSSFVMNPLHQKHRWFESNPAHYIGEKSLWNSVGGWRTEGIFDLCRNVGEKVEVSRCVTDKKGKIC